MLKFPLDANRTSNVWHGLLLALLRPPLSLLNFPLGAHSTTKVELGPLLELLLCRRIDERGRVSLGMAQVYYGPVLLRHPPERNPYADSTPSTSRYRRRDLALPVLTPNLAQ